MTTDVTTRKKVKLTITDFRIELSIFVFFWNSEYISITKTTRVAKIEAVTVGLKARHTWAGIPGVAGLMGSRFDAMNTMIPIMRR